MPPEGSKAESTPRPVFPTCTGRPNSRAALLCSALLCSALLCFDGRSRAGRETERSAGQYGARYVPVLRQSAPPVPWSSLAQVELTIARSCQLLWRLVEVLARWKALCRPCCALSGRAEPVLMPSAPSAAMMPGTSQLTSTQLDAIPNARVGCYGAWLRSGEMESALSAVLCLKWSGRAGLDAECVQLGAMASA